jgi:serine protease
MWHAIMHQRADAARLLPWLQGTSMASPHVTGAAALLWSIKPTCPAATILSTLISTVKDLGEPGRDNLYGWGLIDVNAALQTLATTTCP